MNKIFENASTKAMSDIIEVTAPILEVLGIEFEKGQTYAKGLVQVDEFDSSAATIKFFAARSGKSPTIFAKMELTVTLCRPGVTVPVEIGDVLVEIAPASHLGEDVFYVSFRSPTKEKLNECIKPLSGEYEGFDLGDRVREAISVIAYFN